MESSSKAIYLSGPILAGKTNILYQTYLHAKKQPGWTCFYFTAEHYSISVDDKYRQLFNNLMENQLIQNLAKSTDGVMKAFANPVTDSMGNVLICIDEAQAFCPNSFRVYQDTPKNAHLILQQKDEKAKWNQMIRDIVRVRSKTYILCASSSYELLLSEPFVESPFDKKYFLARYFTEKEVLTGFRLLISTNIVGQLFKNLEDEIIRFVMTETEGYPGICGYIFEIINDLLKRLIREGPEVISISDIWRNQRWNLLFGKLLSSRVVTRIKDEKWEDLSKILGSPVLYGAIVPCDLSDYSTRLCLRCGIFKVVDDRLSLSCNIMKNILFMCSKNLLRGGETIYSFFENTTLNFKELIIYLFKHMPLSYLNQKECWVDSRRNKNIQVPSEKMYQHCFFQSLCSLCPQPSKFIPVLEMNRVKGRVDLCLLTPLGKYQVEFAANVPDKGDFSADSHYRRQVDIYHSNDTIKSAVVVIGNHLRNEYRPVYSVDVDYVQVMHFMESKDVGNQINLQYNQENSVPILLPNDS